MPGNGNPYADTKGMYAVHAIFRREYALLPGLIRAVAAEDEERARVIADHVRLLNLVLHHHHTAEDTTLWPRLLERAPRDIDPVVQLLEGQHENLDVLLDKTDARLDAWTTGAGSADGEALATELQKLAVALYEHMGLEEKLALPLLERHIFASEWAAMVARAAVSIPMESAPVVVGMLMYEGGVESVPPELRQPLAELAPKAYAAYCERVHGTPTPPRSAEVGLGTPYVGPRQEGARHDAQDEMSDPRAEMWEMITGYRISQLVRVAAALSLAEHCADGPVSAELVADLESADVTATARFLRACAAVGLVKSADGRLFTATPLLMSLHRDTPGSLRGFALSLPASGHWLPWGRLLNAVKSGEHQSPTALGCELWDYYEREPAEAAAFTDGLRGMTAAAGAEAARVIDTTGVRLAVDVGGASGDLLHDLMRVNPQLTGVVFDLEQVTPAALAAAERQGFGDRLRVVAGDFFEAIPDGGDLYLLRYVLHDWDDEKCIQILRNCRAAMRPRGRILVLEMILTAIGGEPAAVPSQDLNMLVMLGGRERTVEQFDELFRAAGLRRIKVAETGSPMAVIEAVAGP